MFQTFYGIIFKFWRAFHEMFPFAITDLSLEAWTMHYPKLNCFSFGGKRYPINICKLFRHPFFFFFYFHNLYILLMSSNEGYADFSTGISLLLLIIFPTAVIKLVALWWLFFLKCSNTHTAMSLKQVFAKVWPTSMLTKIYMITIVIYWNSIHITIPSLNSSILP